MAERQDPKLIAKKIFAKQRQILDSLDSNNKEILQYTSFMAIHASLEIMKIMLTSGNIGLVKSTINELESLLSSSLPTALVKVRSAVSLTTTEEKELKKIFQKQTGKEIILSSEVDPDLLGGLVIEFDGKVIDLSVSEELNKLKTHMLTALHKGK